MREKTWMASVSLALLFAGGVPARGVEQRPAELTRLAELDQVEGWTRTRARWKETDRGTLLQLTLRRPDPARTAENPGHGDPMDTGPAMEVEILSLSSDERPRVEEGYHLRDVVWKEEPLYVPVLASEGREGAMVRRTILSARGRGMLWRARSLSSREEILAVTKALCGGDQSLGAKDEEEADMGERGERVAFEVIAQGSQADLVQEAKTVVVTQEEQWVALWKEIHGATLPRPEVPSIDFGQKRLLAVFLGQRPTGGHGVSIEQVTTSSSGGLEVLYEVEAPDEGSMVTMALTAPYVVVAVPAGDGPVTFREGTPEK